MPGEFGGYPEQHILTAKREYSATLRTTPTVASAVSLTMAQSVCDGTWGSEEATTNDPIDFTMIASAGQDLYRYYCCCRSFSKSSGFRCQSDVLRVIITDSISNLKSLVLVRWEYFIFTRNPRRRRTSTQNKVTAMTLLLLLLTAAVTLCLSVKLSCECIRRLPLLMCKLAKHTSSRKTELRI